MSALPAYEALFQAGRLTPTGLGLARRYANLRARVVAGRDIEAWSDACAVLQHKRNAWRTLNDVVDRGREPAGQRFEEFMAALEALATVWGIPAEMVWPVRPLCTSASFS